MAKVFVTREIPDRGIILLKNSGYEVIVNPDNRVLQKGELVDHLRRDKYDAVLCLLTDKIDFDVFDAAKESGVKIFANFAVGFDNVDVKAAAEREILVTNTPDVLTDTVAEHTFALMLAIAHRVSEADRFTRAGKFNGWAPELFLGIDVSKKLLGIIGLGRIGSRVAYHARRGFDMRVTYYDIKRAEEFEREYSAEYRQDIDDVFREADFVSIHVPLLPSTRHLVDARRLHLMKKTAYLVNTSRGPVVDEQALVEVLKERAIRGAALDVFENEPMLAPGLAELENTVLTPHIASATEETRQVMSELAARNIIEALEGRIPPNLVKI